MVLSRAGFPASCGVVGALSRPAALLLSLALGACSTIGPAAQNMSWYPTTTQAVPAGQRAEIEGDGIEGQRPPRRRQVETPDDPTEPYSPNYGSVPLGTHEASGQSPA
jgi:hypothetical protein